MVINKIAEEQGFKEKGYRVIVNCGEDGGPRSKTFTFSYTCR